jgi:hypothetical protein
MSALSPVADADAAPSIRIHPPPTDAELAAIVAAISLGLRGVPGCNEDRITMPTPSRWSEAGRREAMGAKETLPLSREQQRRGGS